MPEATVSKSVGLASEKHEKFKPLWTKSRDAIAGQDTIKQKETQYLPKLEGQDEIKGSYEKYLAGALYYNASGRTKQGYKGLIFRKDPDINLPEGMKEFEQDCTLTGKSLTTLMEEAVEEEIEVSRYAVLVDYPDTTNLPEGVSQADAEAMGLRPYLVSYKAEDILAVKTGKVGNRTVLKQARLREHYKEPGEDEFEENVLEQVRVVELVPEPTGEDEESSRMVYRQRVFRKMDDVSGRNSGSKDDIEWVEMEDMRRYPLMGGSYISEIPLYCVGGWDYREPWMLDLVNVNLHHYVTYADYSAGVKWTTRPQPWATGVRDDELDNLYLGAGMIWKLESTDAQFGMLEYTGKGLSAVEKKLDDLKGDMAILGIRMLVPEKKQVEATETHEIKRSGENSALSTVAGNVSTAITDAIKFAAEWMGAGSDDDIGAELNTDYMPGEIPVDDMVKMWSLVQSNSPFTVRDFVWNMKQGERLDPTIEDEERISQAETSPPPGMGTPNLNGGQ